MKKRLAVIVQFWLISHVSWLSHLFFRFYGIQSALNQSLITEADIDQRLSYLFRIRMRLGHFDPPGPLQQIPTTDICSDYAVSLSMDGTLQGATLLKNTDNALPLSVSIASAAVIGPNGYLSQGR